MRTDYYKEKIEGIIQYYLKNGNGGKSLTAQYISDKLLELYQVKLGKSQVLGKF